MLQSRLQFQDLSVLLVKGADARALLLLRR